MIGKIKEFIIGYPERIVLSVAVIILIIVAFRALTSPPDEYVQRITEKMQATEKILRENPSPKLEEINHLNKITQKWGKLEKSPEIDNGMMYRSSIYVVEYFKKLEIPKKEILPPILTRLTVNPRVPDQVVITWIKNTTVRGKSIAEVNGYRIYRRTIEEKETRLLTELRAPVITPTGLTFTYTDTHNIEPQTVYIYDITALTDEEPKVMTGDKTESSLSETRPITTPKIVELKAEVANLDLEQAFFTIEKYIDGKWEKTKGYFKKGEQVGKGKFITNYKIIDIKEEERKKQIGPDKFIIQKVFKIRLKNIKTGEEIIRETPPSRR